MKKKVEIMQDGKPMTPELQQVIDMLKQLGFTLHTQGIIDCWIHPDIDYKDMGFNVDTLRWMAITDITKGIFDQGVERGKVLKAKEIQTALSY